VSFVEIFMSKGVTALDEGGWGAAGYRWGTMLFFGGISITALLDALVHFLSSLAGQSPDKYTASVTEMRTSNLNKDGTPVSACAIEKQPSADSLPDLESGPADSVTCPSQELQPVDVCHLRHCSCSNTPRCRETRSVQVALNGIRRLLLLQL
jgi:hypothetical protein